MKIRSTITLLLWLLAAAIVHAQIPAGYYDQAAGLSGSPLKSALHRTIRGHTKKTYTFLWTAFYTTDNKTNGTVWDMYSDNPDGSPPYVYEFGTNQCVNTPGYEDGCYNREHSFPNSWFGGITSDTAYTDLFHLYPADSYVNSRRNNNPYGEVNTPTWTSLNGSKLGPCSYPGYTGTVFEPLDAYKGDLARTCLYMATRYETRIASWENYMPEGDAVLDGTSFPCYEPWFLNMLLEWDAADPVSQKEIDRNNDVYAIQGNRNPFIDHSEYVNAIWGGAGVIEPEPTNYPVNFTATTVSGSEIRVTWTDAIGSQLPAAYLIKAAVDPSTPVAPLDGTPESSTFLINNTYQGFGEVLFSGLTPLTTYHFYIWPYTNTGANIDYKTDGSAPEASATTYETASLVVINFDDASKWTAGSGAINSYQTDHFYIDGVFSSTGGPAMRNGTTDQDGFPGALGTYSWRLKNEAINWIMTIASGGVGDFSIDLRRWDNSPSPDYSLDYSIDNGSNWISVTNIDNAALDNSSDWKTFTGTINSAVSNILIRLFSSGTTERIMVDNFSWTPYSSVPVGFAEDLAASGLKVYFAAGNIYIITQPDTRAHVYMYDLTGRLVLQGDTQGRAFLGLCTEGIPNGVYIVSMVEDKGVYSRKVVVQ